MKAQRMFLVSEILSCCLLLFPAPVSSQRPQTPGKLFVTSTPPGATIAIDNQATGQSTDFTFVVSPGDHYVSLTSSSLPNCKNLKKAPVSSGHITRVNCTAAGWDEPASK
jgi:hypothetical protein